jgi:hypothetical protein
MNVSYTNALCHGVSIRSSQASPGATIARRSPLIHRTRRQFLDRRRALKSRKVRVETVLSPTWKTPTSEHLFQASITPILPLLRSYSVRAVTPSLTRWLSSTTLSHHTELLMMCQRRPHCATKIMKMVSALDFNAWQVPNQVVLHMRRLATAMTNDMRSDVESNAIVFVLAHSRKHSVLVH